MNNNQVIDDSMIKKLIRSACNAREQSYSPYSNYCVGAAILDFNDNIFEGTNWENDSYPAGICGERCAISNAIAHKSNKFKANALEIAVWRGSKNKAHIEALINAGMKFSIQEYNKTWVGESIPFDKVDMGVKKVLMKKFVFDKVINQLNIVDEIDKKEKMNFFQKIKIYWREYLDFA